MIFLYILEKLGINVTPPSNSDPIILLCYSFLIISLILLLCFINTSLYYISIVVLKEYEYKLNSYPNLKKILTYFSKFSLANIIIEFILGVICCLIIIFICLLFLIK